ncbi:hypothetical protein UR09_00860 [Candidatus Nitromaritima sp. SCGC AAA799-A02]|nr:hypothetical protein UZ36_07615 [Candidatus Nitromaritima sp. SCGC AAA799-C22]KMP12609.1 hypothetical protein UR09_00860 [Candidatus Nitromaritima sp. SCGC AAA799-A02]
MENISAPSKISHKPVFTFHLRNRSLQLTREGAGFISIVFVVGLAAINTGNNLLYLILAMCCSFIAVSGVLSEMTLKKIHIRAIAPATLYAGEPTPFKLEIANHKDRASSYALRILLSRDSQPHYETDREIYIFDLRPGTPVEKSFMLTASRRGPLKIKSCILSTSFPFGFFIKSKSVPLHIESLVFPEIRKVELPQPVGMAEDGEGIIQPHGEELYALREFIEGDTLDRVHWKSSAKAGNLRVKEFSTGGNQKFTIYLSLTDVESGRPVKPDIMEQRVVESASLAYHLIRRGDEVSLKTPDFNTPFGNAESDLRNIMTFLATVGMENK